MKKWNKERYETVKWLKNSPCIDCAELFPPCVMDYDHRDPSSKNERLSRMKFRPWGEILSEIAKCDLVCACCHRNRTYKAVPVTSASRNYRYHRLILDELKSETPCLDCKANKNSWQMDFDHIGTKSTNVGWLLSSNTNKLLGELVKCELVCANCHRIRTATGNRPKPSDHGVTLVCKFKEIASRTAYPNDRRTEERPWYHLVGTLLDHQVATLAGVDRSSVSRQRRKMGIPALSGRGVI